MNMCITDSKCVDRLNINPHMNYFKSSPIFGCHTDPRTVQIQA